jgi:hypothetical protein
MARRYRGKTVMFAPSPCGDAHDSHVPPSGRAGRQGRQQEGGRGAKHGRRSTLRALAARPIISPRRETDGTDTGVPMSEGQGIDHRSNDRDSQGAPQVIPFPSPATTPQVAFQRDELRTIFNLYGRRVAEGEWRDYALDFRRDKAVFSIYRRTSEMPLYRIEKDPKLARRQGAYAVIAASGLVMKRGNDLARVIGVLDRPLQAV